MNDAPRRWWNILDKALCSYGMVPTRADTPDSGTTQATSQLNRVCGEKQMLHVKKCWIPLQVVQPHEKLWQELFIFL